MKRYLSSGLALSVILALTGCGGGSDDSTPAAATTTGTGYYVDSAVEGINYTCGSQSGITDAAGMFKFAIGQNCTFKLGNVLLKTIGANSLVDNVTIVEDNVTVAAFLQTVDIDGNASNGIQIPTEVVTVLNDDNTTSVPKDSAELSAIFTKLKNQVADYNGTVVSETDAEAHLHHTQASVTKDLLAGKTFYVVHISDSEHFVGEASFDADLTEDTWNGLINDNSSETESLTLEDGNKLVWSIDNSYTIVQGEVREGYILTSDYNADNSSDGKSYLFKTQSAAEAFYYARYPQAPTASTLSFTALEGQPLLDIWSSGYSIDLFTGNTFTFSEYNENNVSLHTDTAEATLDPTDSKKLTLRFTHGSVYDLILENIEDVTTYNGVDVSAYNIKKITETHTCTRAGDPEFEPADWTPTYWDGNSSQPITDTATYVNQYVAQDTGWWLGDGDDSHGHKYMFAPQAAVTAGVAASGDIVIADANGTRENCTEGDCTIYVRTDNVVGTWTLSEDGLLVETVPNEYEQEIKFVDGHMEEADIDIVGKTEEGHWYLGVTPEVLNILMSNTAQ